MLLERDSSLARWPDRVAPPIHVWVQPESDVPGWSAGLPGEIRSAFLEWQSTGIPVRFAFVADSLDAEVHVRWTDRFTEPISGRTRWARDDAWWITDAVITLAVHHHQGELLDNEAMRAMALHEIGHLLGLDHTADPGSIMARRVRVRSLTAVDRATARLLYQLPAGAVR
ncbi:MAG TPA: matrixin family metalloprotease [Gemmatimonadaceae bacterium]|nr:matrixin family metalloprotease [Gemmatimonadaceae bacterium]